VVWKDIPWVEAKRGEYSGGERRGGGGEGGSTKLKKTREESQNQIYVRGSQGKIGRRPGKEDGRTSGLQ
jgi:hypothetical protein